MKEISWGVLKTSKVFSQQGMHLLSQDVLESENIKHIFWLDLKRQISQLQIEHLNARWSGTEYNPEKFRGLIIRPKSTPKAVWILLPSGELYAFFEDNLPNIVACDKVVGFINSLLDEAESYFKKQPVN